MSAKPAMGLMALLARKPTTPKSSSYGDDEEEAAPDSEPGEDGGNVRALCKSAVDAIIAGDADAACEALEGAIKAAQ